VRNKHVAATVVDTDAGIASHAISKVFDRLHTTKTNETGLGLRVSSSIIDDHR